MTESSKGDEQQVPGSADHEPAPVTEQAEVMHGNKARGEVFDQPEAVALPGDTLIARPADEPESDDELG